ncbi:MAG: glycoside hydrolase family 92 protein, partial [Carboxylicivirga sp.]|nr:glycoside hydrolase family 92 protein [Carboxylicivirga sp.]
QYSLFVPHDLKGLSDLLGGKAALGKWLDKLFETQMEHHLGDDSDITGLVGQYAHGNEPSHHMAYLYNYAGKPWKTQEIVRHITNDLYADTPAGICGNEDCGQMSAWYVLSAMGFYSVCPGGDYYEIGSPIFDKVTLNLNNGEQFVITAKNSEEKYVQSLKLNGKRYNKPMLYHADIIDGGQLTFDMGDVPNTTVLTDYPEERQVVGTASMPYLSNPSNFFLDNYKVEMNSDDAGAKIYYTLNGTVPSTSALMYDGPFDINTNTTVKMISVLENGGKSNVATRELQTSKAIELSKNLLKKGLHYDYYEGVYRSAYDFEIEKPLIQGVAQLSDLSMIKRNEWIALDFTGYIDIPTAGDYQFWVSANDGCQLIIDGEEQFESDGRKSKPFEQQTTIALSKGLHHFRLNYYQCSDGIELNAHWKGPGFNRQDIPSKVFFHKK